jgi:hypothetical protein
VHFSTNWTISNSAEESKRLAYLLDLKTIALEDMVFGYSLGQEIRWLIVRLLKKTLGFFIFLRKFGDYKM